MLSIDTLTIRRPGFTLTASFEAQSGSVTALIGPSGAGKTTLLHAIAGFVPPSAGRIRVQGQDITDLPVSDRPVSMLFQDHNLFTHMTVFENTALGLSPDLRLNKRDRERVTDALERLGLSTYASRKPEALSGGQQSRVALARALLRNRPVLLLDEPFSALGPAMRADLAQILKEVAAAQNLSVLLVTHQPEDALRAADHIAVVADGEVTPPRPARDTLTNPTPALADYLGDWRPL
ncbi:MAG: ATP-binding cassette domain-containing protein [Pseudomonadota bacterium]